MKIILEVGKLYRQRDGTFVWAQKVHECGHLMEMSYYIEHIKSHSWQKGDFVGCRFINGGFDPGGQGAERPRDVVEEIAISGQKLATAPTQAGAGDATCDAVIDAVRAVLGGQSASSDATDWANKLQRCRDGIRAALKGASPSEGDAA